LTSAEQDSKSSKIPVIEKLRMHWETQYRKVVEEQRFDIGKKRRHFDGTSAVGGIDNTAVDN
jgi:hypothetical protein